MSYEETDISNLVLPEENKDIRTTQKKKTLCKKNVRSDREEWGRDGPLTHLLHNVRREDSGSKGSAEDVGEFLVQASDSHLLKVPVWVDDCLACLLGLCLTFLKKAQKGATWAELLRFRFLMWGKVFLKDSESKACFAMMERKRTFLRS